MNEKTLWPYLVRPDHASGFVEWQMVVFANSPQGACRFLAEYLDEPFCSSELKFKKVKCPHTDKLDTVWTVWPLPKTGAPGVAEWSNGTYFKATEKS
jgi:hypothetical protein